jgi:hypothetical protein
MWLKIVNFIMQKNCKITDFTEMSIGKKKKFLGSKVRLVRGADNVTAIYEPIVYTTWDL